MYAKSTSPERPSVRGRPRLIEAGHRVPSPERINNRRGDAVPEEECVLQYRAARRGQLKADYTLALARDYCAANEPEKFGKLSSALFTMFQA